MLAVRDARRQPRRGGILALMSLTRASWHGHGRALVIMGLFGAALIYGDGIITPAISVLSALEGLNQATEVFAACHADGGDDPARFILGAESRPCARVCNWLARTGHDGEQAMKSGGTMSRVHLVAKKQRTSIQQQRLQPAGITGQQNPPAAHALIVR
jgi:K+ potassium transporter